ncbi:MAG: hypothetical protein ACR5LD_06885 [Symbiopectobacterium sp.]
MMGSTRDFNLVSGYKANVVALDKMAKTLKIPVLITSSNVRWKNGDTLCRN